MLRKIIAFSLLLLAVASCSKTDTTDYNAVDKQKILDYLAANNLTSVAQSTSTGLYYIITNPGAAYHPNPNSTVRAMYRGYLLDGTVFDQTTYTSGYPATFALSGVIAGWKEGLQLVGVGGKIKLIVPSSLGYGSNATTAIPANSVLVFDIDVVDIYN